MTRAIFVSDIHLESNDDSRFFLFHEWLSSLKGGVHLSHLFLVGDIFDLWIADHKLFLEAYKSIIDEIVRLKNEGVNIHYFEGNHDLYLSKFWEVQLGVNVHRSGQMFELNGKKVFVEHGDQMDPNDKGYLFLRWFLRIWPMKIFAHYAPGKMIEWIGVKAKEKSRHYTSQIKTIDQDKAKSIIRHHVQNLRKQCDFDFHVSGHMHVRDEFEFDFEGKKVELINLGTWLDQPSYFFLDEDKKVFFNL